MKKLRDAIEAVMLHADTTHRLSDFAPELRLLVAAARAFSCPICKGKGRVLIAQANTEVDCYVCRSDRTHIKVYG